MSRIVATLVYSRKLGSMSRKGVMACMADRANDDGSGVWLSKQRIAAEVECTKQTVITTIAAFVSEGLLREEGRHKNRNGYTVEYSINLEALAALPKARSDEEEKVQNPTGQKLDRSNSLTPRGQGALPKPSLNRPTPSEAKASSGDARASQLACGHTKASRIDPNWQAPAVADLPDESLRQIVGGWSGKTYKLHAAKFFNHYMAATGQAAWSMNWTRTWQKWLWNAAERAEASPSGLGRTAGAAIGVFGHPSDDDVEEHAARLERIGRPDEADQCRRNARRRRGAASIGSVAADAMRRVGPHRVASS